MNWRGRTVEYSSDPANHPLVEVSCVDIRRWQKMLHDLLPWASSAWERFCSLQRHGVGREQPQLFLAQIGYDMLVDSPTLCLGEDLGLERVKEARMCRQFRHR